MNKILPRRAPPRRVLRALLAGTALLLLAGCASTTPPAIAVPTVTGPAPVRGMTQMEQALRCLAENYPPQLDLRLAVNDLTDGTGTTMTGDALSKVLTQRPDVMMTIGLSKTGVRLVNRSSTGVAEWELRQAMQKYIGDGRAYRDPATKAPVPYRPVMAGAVLGSTHYVSGALTELNWNLQADVNELGVGGLTVGKRAYRISIAADLIVTNTRSTEIVMAQSYSKQLVGQEFSAGLFRFFDVGSKRSNWGENEVFEFNIGSEGNEPVQTAVRWMLETAAYEIVSELTGIGEACDALVPEASRPQRSRRGARNAEGSMTPRASAYPVAPQGGAAGAPRAPLPPAAAAAAVPNAITGINLFDDDGAVTVRIDTSQPMGQIPVVETLAPDKLAVPLPGLVGAVGGVAPQGLGGVRKVELRETASGSLLYIELAQPHASRMSREGRSLLLQLLPQIDTARQTLSNGSTTSSEDKGGVSGSAVLTPHESPAVVPAEALIRLIR